MEPHNKDWWRLSKMDMPSELSKSFERVKEAESSRTTLDVQNLRLYGNHAHLDFNPGPNDYRHQDRLTYNLCRSVADTIVSQVARHKVAARFLTSGGNASLRRKAKAMGQFVDGEWHRLKMKMLAPQLALDSVVFGTGFLHPFIAHGKICLERVLPSELFVDPAEAMYGRPQTLYRRRWVNRDRLAARFPKQKGAIMTQPSPSDDHGPGLWSPLHGPHRDGLIEVIESWHLPSSPDSQDGKHVIAIQNSLLGCWEWTWSEFPFISLKYGEKLMGWFGTGAVESLTPIQIELNRTLIKLQKMYHLVAVPRVFVSHGASIQKNQINNDIGAVYTYKGEPPIFAPPTQIGGEIFNYIQTLIDRGFSQEGISPFIAAGQHARGLDSGVAIREANELQMGKLALFMNAWDEAHAQLATWLVRLGKELSKRPGGFKFIASKDRNTVEQLDWSSVDIEDDMYVIRVFPTSALPKEPSGRLARVTEMVQMGFTDVATGKKLLDFPDLEEEEALDRAEADLIDRHIELMLDEGIALVPEPFQDATLALKKAQAAYNRAAIQDVGDDRLQLVRTYMMAANAAIQQAQQAQAQVHAQQSVPGAGSPPPTGFDGAPPTAAPGPMGGM